MRLTLRTMLAYLDDILEPADSEDISKKIEESEFATNLVHRTRDCMRRLRLGSPALGGKGLGNDPNTVAEYLDNTLSSDRVPEFEKICLESDMHLAEVASCHQILTLVLGEPAEIDPASRQRMYRLAAHADAPPVQTDMLPTGAVRAVMSAPVAPSVSRRSKPEVPDYLRETRSRFWPVAAMVLVGALLSGGALYRFAPVEWRERATALVQTPATDVDVATNAGQAIAPTARPSRAGGAADEDQNVGATNQPGASEQVPAPREPAQSASDSMPVTRGSDADRTVSADSLAPPTTEPAETGPARTGVAETAASPIDLQPSIAATPIAPLPDTVLGATQSPAAISREANPLRTLPANDALERSGSMPTAEREPTTENFGQFNSKRGELLLKFDTGSGDWKLLPTMSPLAKGDRLMSLPLFRPTLRLTTNVTIQADGPSQFELLGWTDDGTPRISVKYGRFWLATIGKAGNAVQLQLDSRQSQLNFVDAESTVALDVRRELPPGNDPADAAPLIIDVYSTSGLVRISEDDSSFELQAPARRTLWSAARQQGDKFPDWIAASAPNETNLKAMAALEAQLVGDRPVTRTLKEYLTDPLVARRKEVRSLAIRSLCQLGDFDACVQSLNDKDEKTFWPTAVEELRSAVARDPQTASRVRSTFESRRGADAVLLYRILWGYSLENLKAGADRELVRGLDHDSLDMRVLSISTLRSITNLPTHGYQATDQAAERRRKVQAWEKDLKDGKIVPRSASK